MIEMRDNEFDDIFSRELRGEQKYLYEEQDWEHLTQRLDRDKGVLTPGNSSTVTSDWRKLLWLLPLLFLFLGMNVWWSLKTQAIQEQNAIMLDEVKKLRESLIEKNSIPPPLQTVVERDTIIIYRYLAPNTTPMIPKAIEKYIDNTLENDKNKSSNLDIGQNLAENGTSIAKKQLIEPVMPLRQQHNWDSVRSIAASKLPIFVANVPPIPILQPKLFNRFFIGPAIGLINYHSAWFNKDNIEIFKNEKSYQVGLKMEYALTKNWRIMLSGDYCPFDFKIYWLDKRYNLPEIPSYYANNPNLKFKSVNAQQQLIQGSFGLKYYLKGTERWRPFVGGAYSMMRILPFQAEYEFTEANRFVYSKSFQNTVKVNNVVILNAGLEYQLSPRLYTQLDVFYNRDINSTQKTYDIFGIRNTWFLGLR